MKKEIVPGLYVSSEYLNKFNISIHSPIQVNFGLYIITIETKEILYYHYFDNILKWDLTSFKIKYQINKISELASFFQKIDLPKILIEDDVDIFTLGGLIIEDEISDWKKSKIQLKYRENSFNKIKKLVNRGASAWYIWFFKYCFFGYYDSAIYLTDKGFVIENADKVFLSTFRTIQINLYKLKKANIIDFKLNQKNIEEIKFNAEYLLIQPILTPIIYWSSIYNYTFESSINDNITFEPINNSLKPINIFKKNEFPKGKSNVDFQEKMQSQDEIGKRSEKEAFEFEKKRLISLGYNNPEELIKNVSDNPIFGFDILSIEAEGIKRHIEVKTLKSFHKAKRFFISRNELEKSKILENYYLYLVSYTERGANVRIVKCDNIDSSENFLLIPTDYEVIIDF